MSPSLDDLKEWLVKSGAHPMDATHLAAILEMNGWTDRQATLLGYDDVFALAEAVYPFLFASFQSQPVAPDSAVPWYSALAKMIGLYLRGLVFALPMVLSSLSVLTLKYSVWSYVGFSTEIATGIALGTFASFLAVGGFTQAIARRGLFYLAQNQYALARISSLQLLTVGILAVIINFLVFSAAVTLVPVLPWSILRVTAVFYFLLAVTWLGATLFYMLKMEFSLLALVAAGIGLVYWQFEHLDIPMIQAQVLAMAVVAACTILISLIQIRRLASRNKDGQDFRAVMPRWSQVARSLAPYFIFGLVYFALLFTDRLLAWSVPGEFHPFVIWFLGDYELGLDWALWTLILPMGIAEVYIHSLFQRVSIRQPLTAIDQLEAFNRRFQREHSLANALALMTGLVSIFPLILLIGELTRIGLLAVNPLANPVTRLVFFIAAPAYGLIVVGLLNSLVLFSLSVPWPVVLASLWALAGNLLVGFLASRYGGYQWAVLGLVAGAALFAFFSTRAAYRVIGRLDYHLMRLV